MFYLQGIIRGIERGQLKNLHWMQVRLYCDGVHGTCPFYPLYWHVIDIPMHNHKQLKQ